MQNSVFGEGWIRIEGQLYLSLFHNLDHHLGPIEHSTVDGEELKARPPSVLDRPMFLLDESVQACFGEAASSFGARSDAAETIAQRGIPGLSPWSRRCLARTHDRKMS